MGSATIHQQCQAEQAAELAAAKAGLAAKMLEIEKLRMQIAGNSLDAPGRWTLDRENPSMQLVVMTGSMELAGVEFLEGGAALKSAR